MGRNPFKKGVDFLKASSNEIQASYNTAASRTLHLAGLSGAGNLLLGFFKIASGVLALSIFTCVNVCYT